MTHRAAFDDRELTSDWRRNREVVKGRFLRGNLGYVFSDELELYANAFQRPLERRSREQERVLDTLTHIGPLTPRQIKEETGLLNKELMPILHRLQQAFLVYEDQLDTNWERPWSSFPQECPDVAVDLILWEEAAREVLRRFLRTQVLATSENIRDWSGWPVAAIKCLIDSMEADGEISVRTVEGLGEGLVSAEEVGAAATEPVPGTFMLHKSDPLVRCCASELKRHFKGLEVLQYLLIDGNLQGAACGHWRIGPHDVEDIVVNLSPVERAARKNEIVRAVEWGYHPPLHRVLRYAGELL